MRIALFASGYVGARAFDVMLEKDVAPALTVLEGDLDGKADDIRSRLRSMGMSDTLLLAGDLDTAALAGRIRSLDIDIGILAWWPLIIREPVLSSPKQGFLNFHPSLLPFNRGKHTTFWNIVEDVPFGVIIHWVDGGLDTGPVAFQREIEKTW
jgi:methionyl-tRNA formyltransferase